MRPPQRRQRTFGTRFQFRAKRRTQHVAVRIGNRRRNRRHGRHGYGRHRPYDRCGRRGRRGRHGRYRRRGRRWRRRGRLRRGRGFHGRNGFHRHKKRTITGDRARTEFGFQQKRLFKGFEDFVKITHSSVRTRMGSWTATATDPRTSFRCHARPSSGVPAPPMPDRPSIRRYRPAGAA